jgi:hypothetical protein
VDDGSIIERAAACGARRLAMGRWVAVALCLLLLPVPVAAKKKDKHKDKGGKDDRDVTVVVFSPVERERVRLVFAETHGRGKCPPGLAKKNNGCLPPGQAKKRYTVGKVLPREIPVGDVPKEIAGRIGKAPAGYRYGIVDGDLVKLSLGTMLVADAIDGLVD